MNFPDHFSQADIDEWNDWYNSRPICVQAAIAQCPPDRLYRLKGSGRVFITSYQEDNDGEVTATVDLTAKHNYTSLERRIFGIALDDLAPCEPPHPEELVGVYTTPDEQLALINDARRRNGLSPVDTLEAVSPSNVEFES